MSRSTKDKEVEIQALYECEITKILQIAFEEIKLLSSYDDNDLRIYEVALRSIFTTDPKDGAFINAYPNGKRYLCIENAQYINEVVQDLLNSRQFTERVNEEVLFNGPWTLGVLVKQLELAELGTEIDTEKVHKAFDELRNFALQKLIDEPIGLLSIIIPNSIKTYLPKIEALSVPEQNRASMPKGKPAEIVMATVLRLYYNLAPPELRPKGLPALPFVPTSIQDFATRKLNGVIIGTAKNFYRASNVCFKVMDKAFPDNLNPEHLQTFGKFSDQLGSMKKPHQSIIKINPSRSIGMKV